MRKMWKKLISLLLTMVLLCLSAGVAQEENGLVMQDIARFEDLFVEPVLDFEMGETKFELEGAQGAGIAMYSTAARAVSGVYSGMYDNILWTLNTATGILSISGSGQVLRGWYYNNTGAAYTENDFLGDYIKRVDIGEGITSIGNSAFYGCTQLTQVNLPSTLTSIVDVAFMNCTNLTTISLPANLTTLGTGCFAYSGIKTINFPSGLKEIGYAAFLCCEGLTSVALPSSVTKVDEQAFAACLGLNSATVYGTIGVDAFNNCTGLTSLTLGSTVSSIGDRAFAYCTSLLSVTIPNGVKDISYGAFANCTSMMQAVINGNIGESAFHSCNQLSSVTINASCASIGNYAFGYCTSLQSLTLPEKVTSIGDGAFISCTSLTGVNLPSGLISIGNYAFQECSALQDITVPSSVNSLGMGVFVKCSALENLVLPDSMISIGSGALAYCTSLEEVHLPDALEKLGEQAFYGCTALKSIDIPEGISEIDATTFYQCESLETVTLPDNLKCIGHHAFSFCGSLRAVEIPENVTEIGEYAFCKCAMLESIALPEGMTTVSNGLLSGCPLLKSVSIPETVMSIGEYVFYACEQLETIVLPQKLTDVGKAAFAFCAALTQINLPACITQIPDGLFLECKELQTVNHSGEITSIGYASFANCQKLQCFILDDSITSIGQQAFLFCYELPIPCLPAQLEEIGWGAFGHCRKLKSVHITAAVSSIGDMVFSGCTELDSITVDAANEAFVSQDGLLYTADMTRILGSAPRAISGEIVIPDTVTFVSSDLFLECKNLTAITLPEGLAEISDYMFACCTELEKISIPSSVTRIGDFAFFLCQNLKNVHISENVTEVGESAFLGCEALETVDILGSVSKIEEKTFCGCESLTSVVLPSSVKEIGADAFSDCFSLQSVQLPAGLLTIGDYAFANCTQLEKIEIPTSVESVGIFAFGNCARLTSVTLPQNLEYVSAGVFSGCTDLETVDLKGSISLIGKSAFYGAEQLRELQFGGDAPGEIQENAFSGTPTDLVFYYDHAASGWTSPEWKGPDGKTYNTATFIKGTCGIDLKWSLNTGTGELRITGTGAMDEWDETHLPPWYENRELIRSVIIEQGATSLGAYAFTQCIQLGSVVLPDSITQAGYGVFAVCEHLAVVEVPGGLRSLSECMFYQCNQLEEVSLHESVKEIPRYAFFGCWNLKNIVIPEAIKTIGEGAFGDCISMNALTVRASLDKVDAGAFFNCNSLRTVYWEGQEPKTIGEYAFYGLNQDLKVYSSIDTSSFIHTLDDTFDSLEPAYQGTCGNQVQWSIQANTGVLTIAGSGAMNNFAEDEAPWIPYKSMIRHVEIGDGVTSIGSYAFADIAWLESIKIADSVLSIGKYALSGCTVLSSIELPSGLKEVGEGAFSFCYSLASIYIPDGIREIPDYLFTSCVKLEKVTGASNVEKIGYGAFYYCCELNQVFTQNVLNEIEGWAFAACVSLQNMTFGTNVSRIGDYAFFYCEQLSTINLGDNISNIGIYAFAQTGISAVKLPVNLQRVQEGVFELCEKLTEVELGSSTSILETRAFYGCQNLEGIDLKNVAELDDFALAATGLKTADIPSDIISIGQGVFADCPMLTSVNTSSSRFACVDGVLYEGTKLLCFPAGMDKGGFAVPDFVTEIDGYAFYGCRKLVRLDMNAQVKTIGPAAFAYCEGLQELVLGKISSFPEAMLAQCGQLSMIHFTGDAPSSFGNEALASVPDTVVFEYLFTSEGWTEEIWMGPDGKNYHTSCARYEMLSCDDVSVRMTKDGNAQINLVLRNEGNTEIVVSEVTLSSDQFALSMPQETIVIPAGESNSTIFVSNKASMDVSIVNTCTATIRYGERALDVSITFHPWENNCSMSIVQSPQTIGNSVDIQFQVTNSGTIAENVLIVVAMYGANGQFIDSASKMQTLDPGQRYNIGAYGKGLISGGSFEVMLMDPLSMAPLCDALTMSFGQINESAESCVRISWVYSLDDPCPSLPDVEQGTTTIPGTNIEDEDEEYVFALELDVAAAPAGAATPATVWSTTIELQTVLAAEQSPAYYSGSVSVDITDDSPTLSHDGAFSDQPKTKAELGMTLFAGGEDNSGELWQNRAQNNKVVEFKTAGSYDVSMGGYTVKEGFTPPSAKVNGKLGLTLVKTSNEWASWKLSDHVKLKIKTDGRLGAAEVTGEAGLFNDEAGLNLGVGGSVEALGFDGIFELSNENSVLVSVTLGGTAGASAKGAVAVGSVIRIKLKVAAGVGGNIEVAVNVGEMWKAAVKSDTMAKMKDVWHDLAVKFNGISKAVRFKMDGNGMVTDLRVVPDGVTISEMDYSENMCKAALPASSGGVEMPKSVVIVETPPVGKVDTTVVQPTISQSQINEISKLFSVIMSLGVPQKVAESIINSRYNLDTGGWTQMYGMLPHADVWLSTSLRFDAGAGFEAIY